MMGILVADRRDDARVAGLTPMPMLWSSLHLKLTGAMLLVLTLDGTGYLLTINSIGERQTALISCLQDIFVAVAVLTIAAGLVLPGMIGHAAGEVAQAANHLATGALADLSAAMQALGGGELMRVAVAMVEGSAPRGAAPIVVAAIGPVVIAGDSMRLERVLQNVIGNAVTYSPGGTPVQLQQGRQPVAQRFEPGVRAVAGQ